MQPRTLTGAARLRLAAVEQRLAENDSRLEALEAALLGRQGAASEPAAGNLRLAAMIRLAGREVIASDLHPRDGSAPLDFLHDAAPDTTRGAIVVTNPPYNALDAFIARGLDLLDRDHVRVLVLLLRHDHLTAGSRVATLNRATREVHCNWRPRWIAGSNGSPRWSFAWLVWTKGPRRPPLYLRRGVCNGATFREVIPP